MSYSTRGGIFAGLDDTDPVLRGLDDKRGVYALSGLDDTDPVLRGLRGLGETPPGTSDVAKKKARKSFYYLYSLAAMEPVFRKQTGISTGVGVAGIVAAIVTGGLSLLVAGGAAAAGAIMAAGTENCVMEATLWWQRSKKDRDAYIKNAMVGDDVKAALRKAAARMDAATKGVKDPLARQRARARAYFQDFIAVGPQAALKSLNADQQASFGYSYLSALSSGKKIEQALAAGNAAAASAAAAQAKANKALQMKQIKEKIAAARRKHQEALAAAKIKKIAAAKQRTVAAEKLAAALPKQAPGQVNPVADRFLANMLTLAARRLVDEEPSDLKKAIPLTSTTAQLRAFVERVVQKNAGKPVAALIMGAFSDAVGAHAATLNANVALPPAVASEIKTAQVQMQQAQAEELQVDQQIKVVEQAVTATAADEQKVAAEVAVADKEALAAQEPTAVEKADAAETDSAEDKETDKVADKLAPAATATSTTPDAAAPATPAEAVAQAQTEAKGGFPVVPVLAIAGIGAFLWMRSKKSK
jgi:hypothetical protein